jgi:hypothetical protein
VRYFFRDGYLATLQTSAVKIWAGLKWLILRVYSWFSSVPPGIMPGSTLNYATTISFHTLSMLLFTVTGSLEDVYFESLTVSLNKL